jgi:hypothetical protein
MAHSEKLLLKPMALARIFDERDALNQRMNHSKLAALEQKTATLTI